MKQCDLKPEAIKLRRQGYTSGEIRSKLGPIPKSTLSGWLKPITLNHAQKFRILAMARSDGQVGRQLGAMMNHQKRLDRLKIIFEQAQQEVRFRLYLRSVYANEKCEQFWQQVLDIPSNQFLKSVFKPTIRKYKKNPAYKGCLRVEVRGSELYWKTIAWRDCLYDRL